MQQKDIRMLIRNRLLNDLKAKQEREQKQRQRIQTKVFLDLPAEELGFRFFMHLDSRIICA
jgi:hypothetical protein